jgi:hypothetical protein
LGSPLSVYDVGTENLSAEKPYRISIYYTAQHRKSQALSVFTKEESDRKRPGLPQSGHLPDLLLLG